MPQPSRRVLYCESSLDDTALRLRRLLALLGYRWRGKHSEGSPVLLEIYSARRAALALLALALAALAFLALLSPKVARAQVFALTPGSRQAVAMLPGTELTAPSNAANGLLPVSLSEGAGKSQLRLRPHLPVLFGTLALLWHGGGLTATIEQSNAETGGGEAALTGGRLVVTFLPGEKAKYVTLPQTQASLRLAQADRSQPALLVAVVSPGAASGSEEYLLLRRTTLSLSGALLAITPGEYYLLSATSLDLLYPALTALAIALLCSLALLVFRGEPLSLSLAARGGIIAIEIEAFATPGAHRWWRLMVHLALRSPRATG